MKTLVYFSKEFKLKLSYSINLPVKPLFSEAAKEPVVYAIQINRKKKL